MKNDKEPKNQNLHIRLTKEQMEFLDFISWENDMTKTEMILRAVKWYGTLHKYAPEVIEELEREYSKGR